MSKQLEQTSRKSLRYRGNECLNCGHPLEISDRYCSYCGQLNSTKKLSLQDYFGEFIISIVNYDSRFRYTVKDLLFKPGVITRNFTSGKRMRYANPFRFFLSVGLGAPAPRSRSGGREPCEGGLGGLAPPGLQQNSLIATKGNNPHKA